LRPLGQEPPEHPPSAPLAPGEPAPPAPGEPAAPEPDGLAPELVIAEAGIGAIGEPVELPEKRLDAESHIELARELIDEAAIDCSEDMDDDIGIEDEATEPELSHCTAPLLPLALPSTHFALAGQQ